MDPFYSSRMRRLAAQYPAVFAVWLDRAREGHQRVHHDHVSGCPICCPVFAVIHTEEERL